MGSGARTSQRSANAGTQATALAAAVRASARQSRIAPRPGRPRKRRPRTSMATRADASAATAPSIAPASQPQRIPHTTSVNVQGTRAALKAKRKRVSPAARRSASLGSMQKGMSSVAIWNSGTAAA